MSFRRLESRPIRPGRGKKKTKPEWDSTVSDLSVFKATPEEIRRRREAHQSANAELIKQQEMIKAARQARLKADKNSSHLLREVLYDQSQLEDTLIKTDRALAVVKDLFGDNPMRYQAIPTVTTAPKMNAQHIKETKRLDALVPSLTEEPTELDRLSESVHDKTALNEVDSQSSGEESDEENNKFHGSMDLRRFRQYLEEEQEATDPSKHEDFTPVRAGPAAINDTAKVQRTQSRLTSEGMSQEPSFVNSTTDFKHALGHIDAQLSVLEQKRKMNTNNNNNSTLTSESYTGYADAMMEAISRISSYLKETEEILISETNLRQQLMNEVANIRSLTEMLTNEFTALRENQIKLEQSLHEHKDATQQQFNYLLGLIGTGKNLTSEDGVSLSGSIASHRPESRNSVVHKRPEASPSVDELANQKTSALRAIPDHLRVHSPAIMLSPPRQSKDYTPRMHHGHHMPLNEGQSPMSRQIATLGEEHKKAHERLQQLQQMYAGPVADWSSPEEVGNFTPECVQPNPAERDNLKLGFDNGDRFRELVNDHRRDGSLRTSNIPDFQSVHELKGAPYKNIEVYDSGENYAWNKNNFNHVTIPCESQMPMSRASIHESSVPVRVTREVHPPSQTLEDRHHSDLVSQRTPQQAVGSLQLSELENETLARQIEELTRQHSEAQNKLSHIVSKQHKIDMEEEKPHVSPSISPIGSEVPEKDVGQWGTPTERLVNTSKRAITVSVPRVEEMSITTTPSPQGDLRSVRKIPYNRFASAGTKPEDWLGLAAHMER